MSNRNLTNQVINISTWDPDDTYDGIFSKGAREKSVYFSPPSPPLSIIKPNWRYLYKKSSHRYPHQFWIEILAYRFSLALPPENNIIIPPAHPAYQADEDQPYGALIEWFYDAADSSYFDGGIIVERFIPNFDRKKGTQHNLNTIIETFPWFVPPEETGDLSHTGKQKLRKYWAQQLTFDSLIGNVDRHQDNWGIIAPHKSGPITLSPVFDNGTSMSYEILEENFHKFDDPVYTNRYLTKAKYAKHHMKWSLEDMQPMNFFDFMKKLVSTYPETNPIVRSLLNFTEQQVREIWQPLVELIDDPIYALTQKRLDFTLKMLMVRRKLLENKLNELD